MLAATLVLALFAGAAPAAKAPAAAPHEAQGIEARIQAMSEHEKRIQAMSEHEKVVRQRTLSEIAAGLKAVEREPKNARAMLDLSRAYGRVGDGRRQAVWAAKAMALAPRLASAYVSYGQGLYGGYGPKRAKEAEVAFRKAKELDPGDPLPTFCLGGLAEDRGEHELALRLFQESLRLDDRFEAGYYQLALLLSDLGRFPEAKAALAKLLQLDPGHYDGRVLQSWIEESSAARRP